MLSILYPMNAANATSSPARLAEVGRLLHVLEIDLKERNLLPPG